MESNNKVSSKRREKILSYIGLSLAVFFILPIISWGFTFYTIMVLLIWFLYFKATAPQQKYIKLTLSQHILLLFILAILSSLLVGIERVERLQRIKSEQTQNQ